MDSSPNKIRPRVNSHAAVQWLKTHGISLLRFCRPIRRYRMSYDGNSSCIWRDLERDSKNARRNFFLPLWVTARVNRMPWRIDSRCDSQCARTGSHLYGRCVDDDFWRTAARDAGPAACPSTGSGCYQNCWFSSVARARTIAYRAIGPWQSSSSSRDLSWLPRRRPVQFVTSSQPHFVVSTPFSSYCLLPERDRNKKWIISQARRY